MTTIWIWCTVLLVVGEQAIALIIPQQLQQLQPAHYRRKTNIQSATCLLQADIVIPSIFNLSDWKDADNDKDEDERIWVPQTDCLSFRPLCFCTSQGYYVNLLKFKGGGILGRHRHSSPVHAVTFKGSWGYR